MPRRTDNKPKEHAGAEHTAERSDTSARLTRDEAAELARVRPKTWSSYVSRGQAPAPIDYISRTPLWDRADVETWLNSRPGPGARTDLRMDSR